MSDSDAQTPQSQSQWVVGTSLSDSKCLVQINTGTGWYHPIRVAPVHLREDLIPKEQPRLIIAPRTDTSTGNVVSTTLVSVFVP